MPQIVVIGFRNPVKIEVVRQSLDAVFPAGCGHTGALRCIGLLPGSTDFDSDPFFATRTLLDVGP